MAGEIAQAFVRIKPNLSGFRQETEKGVKGAFAGLGNIGASAGAAVATGLKVGTIAAAGLGVAVGAAGLKFDSMRQQAEIAFTTMLGSGEQARAFLDELQTFAATTPFEFPGLVQSSQKLLAMGFAAEEVIPTLTAIGDAVAGLGGGAEQLDQVTRALGQIQAKGKASAEELLQLTEAGIPAWQMLADKIGKSIPEAMEQVKKGAIDSRTTIDAVVEGINARFGGMMEKQSHSMMGMLSTLKDTFNIISGTIMAPFFEMATSGLQRVVDFLPRIQAYVDEFMARDGIRAKLNMVWEDVQGAATSLAGNLGEAVAAIDWGAVWSNAKDIGKGIADVIKRQLDKVDWDGVGQAVANGVTAGLQAGGRIARSVADTIQDAVGRINWEQVGRVVGPGLASAIVVAFGTLTDPGFWVRNWDLALAVGLAAFAGPLGRVATGLFRMFRGALGKVIDDAVLAFADDIERLGPAFVSAFLFVERMIGAALAKLGAGVTALLGRITSKLGSLLTFVVKVLGIQGAIRAIRDFAGDALGWFQELGSDIAETLKRKSLLAVSLMIEPFTHLPKFLGGWARSAQEAVNAELEGMAAGAAVAGAKVGEAFGSAFMNTATPFLSALTGQATLPAGSTGKVTGDVSGVLGGVTSMAGVISGTLGTPVNVMSGFRPGSKVAGSGNTSLHASGRAVDLGPYYGPTLIKVGQAALMAAGMSPAEAKKHQSFYGTVNGWEIIFNCKDCGGDHTDHVHVGMETATAPATPPPPVIPTPDLPDPIVAGSGKKVKETAAAAITDLPGRLRERLAIAEGTKQLKDDIAVLEDVEALLESRLARTKDPNKRADLQEELNNVRGRLRDIRGELAEVERKKNALALEKIAEASRKAIERAKNAVAALRGPLDSAFSNLAGRVSSAFDRITERTIAARRSLLTDALAEVETERKGETPAEKELRELREKRSQDAMDKRKQDIRSEIEFIRNNWPKEEGEARTEAQEKLNELERQLEEANLDELERTLERRAQAERLARDQKAVDRAAELQKEFDDWQLHYEDMRQMEKDALDASLAALNERFVQGKIDAGSYMASLKALFAEYEIPFQAAGDTLGLALNQGLQNALAEVNKTIAQYESALGRLANAQGAIATGETTRQVGGPALGLPFGIQTGGDVAETSAARSTAAVKTPLDRLVTLGEETLNEIKRQTGVIADQPPPVVNVETGEEPFVSRLGLRVKR